MPPVKPEDLVTCLRVLAELSNVEPDDPIFLEVERAAAHLRKETKRRRRLAREQRRARTDRALIEATAMVRAKRAPGRPADPARAFPAAAAPLPDPALPSTAIGTLRRARRCYVCKGPYREVHAVYHRLCPDCADLNWRRRHASADLRGRRALVTGGRIKIGRQVALSLLRWGAEVTITTRFPSDAARRYASEPDAGLWSDRLRIVGLDLLRLGDLQRFLDGLLAEGRPLDALVNNAAQTVRRESGWYAELAAGERRLGPGPTDLPARPVDHEGQPLDRRERNSWLLRVDEVSPEELVETTIVNQLAPFLLVARTRGLMTTSPFPDRYVVNVSAMEGKFDRPGKPTRHAHTNMAKAALNMLTRTAAADYAGDGIYMTSVDTGWITDENPAPLRERLEAEGFRPPLDVADGAARVLDPIVRGVAGERLHGVFLKDYRPTEW